VHSTETLIRIAPRMRGIAIAVAMITCCTPVPTRAQLSGTAAQAESIDAPWGLRLAPEIGEHPLPAGASPAVFGIGESANGSEDRDMSLKGKGEIRRNNTIVKGDAVHYDVDSNKVDAYGHVHVVDDNDVFVGPEAHLRVDANEGYMTAPTYHFNLTGGSGSAERVDMIDNERSVVHRGTYTACQCADDPSWYLDASRFDIDSGTNEGIAHNGVLFFEGVPVFASPWLSFPLSNTRQSGLLPPTISLSSTNGYDVALPYYFNIAPNYDLTVTPRIMSKRGAMLTTNFRYLSPSYSGTTTIAYLPNDAITKTNRYSISFRHDQNFGDGFAAYVNYARVSDANVTTDLNASNAYLVNGQDIFQQEAGVTYNNGPWSVLARVQRWQSFTTSPPYNRDPELDVKYAKYDIGGFDFGAEADATRFSISTSNSTEGSRFTFNPFVSYPLAGPGWFITPKLQWHFNAYDLSSIASTAPAGQPRNFSFNVPTLSLDSGLVFERSVRLFGTDFIQTLEPRLFYVYTPYRNQTFAPVFDTGEEDFGLAQIFTDNSFAGGDRVADLNRLTAAVTTRFIDRASGDERARFVIAQEYYFTNPQVTLIPGESTADVRGTDIIAGASFKIGNGFSTEQAVQYDEQFNRFDRTTSGFTWKPADRQVLSIAYRYTRADEDLDNEPENQIVASSQWPLTRRLYVVGQANFDMVAHRLVAGLLGVQYDADCWSLSLAVQKYTNAVTTTSEPSSATRVLLQLQLKGLTKIDNGLSEQFRSSIPGYTPLPSPAAPESRFSDYE
jgi:LPS-assembly protein